MECGNGPRAEDVKSHDEAVRAGLLGVGAGSLTGGGCSAGWFDFLRPIRSLTGGGIYSPGAGARNRGLGTRWTSVLDMAEGVRVSDQPTGSDQVDRLADTPTEPLE